MIVPSPLVVPPKPPASGLPDEPASPGCGEPPSFDALPPDPESSDDELDPVVESSPVAASCNCPEPDPVPPSGVEPDGPAAGAGAAHAAVSAAAHATTKGNGATKGRN